VYCEGGSLNIGDSAAILQGDVCWQIQLEGYFYR
jgi:hypothetical protein